MCGGSDNIMARKLADKVESAGGLEPGGDGAGWAVVDLNGNRIGAADFENDHVAPEDNDGEEG